MKILGISDLHGVWPKSLKKLIEEEKIDLIVSPGDFGEDLTSKFYEVYKQGESRQIEDVVGREKWKNYIEKEAKSTANIIKKLDSLGVPVLCVYGNGDSSKRAWYWKGDPYFEKYLGKLKNVTFLEYSSKKINGYIFYGIGNKFTKLIKENTKIREVEKQKLDKMFAKNDASKVILITHEAPYLIFDKVLDKRSFRYGMNIGDDVLRDFIRRSQPLLHIFGHMHEYWGPQKLGRTVCVNCGYGLKGRGVIIELPEVKVRRIRI